MRTTQNKVLKAKELTSTGEEQGLVSEGQLNNWYQKDETSSLSLDDEITSADGSLPRDSSTSSFQNNLKLKMNESFISEF